MFSLTAFVVINAVSAFFVLAPGLVTYAQVPPKGITYSACEAPDVQKALTAAAIFGHATIR